ncbi:MAG: ribulose-phosphate 3-epimerase [Candidatus Omnitrophota bacterium]
MKILPSLLSAPFGRLEESLRSLEAAGADVFHFDVMDGHFVPNLTMGPLLIENLQPLIQSQFDVHLMVTNPDEQIPWFDFPSVRSISFHIEAPVDAANVLEIIRERMKKTGIVINPPTKMEALGSCLEKVDQVLVMTVNPGFGGQKFHPEVLPKIEWLAKRREQLSAQFLIQVDGGIGEETIRQALQAGAQEFVAGYSIFGKENAPEAFRNLSRLVGD